MFCLKCGREIKDNAKYCPQCGAQIVLEEVKKTSGKKSKGKILILGISAVAIAFVLLIAAFVFLKQEKERTEATSNSNTTEAVTETQSIKETESIKETQSITETKNVAESETETMLSEISKTTVESAFAPVLTEYDQAYGEGFLQEYTFVSDYFKNDNFYKNQPIYYTFYDFCKDGTPELVISVYFEDSDTYEIVDIYGMDEDFSVERLIGKNNFGPPLAYKICENNVFQCSFSSGGRSTGGIEFYQMKANRASGEFVEGIAHDGYAICYKLLTAEDEMEEKNMITEEEYREVQNKYSILTALPFVWTRFSSVASGNAETTVETETKEAETETEASETETQEIPPDNEYTVTKTNVLGSNYQRVDFNIWASSTLEEEGYNHEVSALQDNDPDTCWAEGAAGYGIGEEIVFSVSDAREVDALYIKPGFSKSEELFYKNGCPTRIKIRCGDSEETVDISDYEYSKDGFLIVDFWKTFTVGQCSVIIDEVREGWKHEDTCFTELYFLYSQ